MEKVQKESVIAAGITEMDTDVKEDTSLPVKMEIGYSKSTTYITLLVIFILIAGGVYLMKFTAEERNTYVGLILIILGAHRLYKTFGRLRDKEPKLIISEEGMATMSVPFKSWTEIYDEKVGIRTYKRNSEPCISYLYGDKKNPKMEILNIDNLAVSFNDLANILYTYRIRFERKK